MSHISYALVICRLLYVSWEGLSNERVGSVRTVSNTFPDDSLRMLFYFPPSAVAELVSEWLPGYLSRRNWRSWPTAATP